VEAGIHTSSRGLSRRTTPSFEPGSVGVSDVGKRGIGIWDLRISADRVAQYLTLVATSVSNVWNEDLYRLLDVQGFPETVAVSFAEDFCFRYRYGFDILTEELIFSLIEADFDSDRVVLDKGNLLPLREYFLPNAARFEDYESRVCGWGPCHLRSGWAGRRFHNSDPATVDKG
jgi:hypothetical protein